jgi:hypothetical protein
MILPQLRDERLSGKGLASIRRCTILCIYLRAAKTPQNIKNQND